MKTNKSYTKRIKITKTGKMLVRKPGKCHFRAKADRTSQLEGKKMSTVVIKNKARGRYLSNSF